MANPELCLTAILEFFATRVGLRGNVETLATWEFQFALDSYFDAGDKGRDPPSDWMTSRSRAQLTMPPGI